MFDRTTPRMTVPTLILLEALLCHADELTAVQIHTMTGLGVGTIFRLLDRLAECGWVESRWEEEIERDERPIGMHRRRYHRLSAGGAALALTSIAVLQRSGPNGRLLPAPAPRFS
jgi:PadR family transcriptional regulator, regulatory protein PadR